MLQDKTWKQIIIMPTEGSFSTLHKNKQASHTHTFESFIHELQIAVKESACFYFSWYILIGF